MATVSDITNITYSGINAIDALMQSGPGWNYLTPQRNTLFFTFDITGAARSNVTSLAPFGSNQQEAAYEAIEYISSVTGILFVEVEDGEHADLHFAAGNINPAEVAGLCGYEQRWESMADGTLTRYEADAYVYLDIADFAEINTNPEQGSEGYEVLLHELGHSLGLKHPFEGPSLLPVSEDTTDNTLMSYVHTGGIKSVYQEYDLLALEWLYGGDGLGGLSGCSDQSVVRGTKGNDNLVGTSGNDMLYGESGADSLNGGAGNDVLTGGDGNDILTGGTGRDTMIGGRGKDVYSVDNTADTIIETGLDISEVDTVVSSVSWILGVNLEKLTLNGTAAINGTGNALNNTLVGNSSANILNGSTGIDTLIGGTGNDTYYVDNAADITTETSTLATEIDTVVSSVSRTLGANLERLTLSGTAPINGTGNTLHNTLVGNAAANVLNGGGGNDVLNGGAGADTLIGGTGNDTYHVDNASDVTTETSTLATEIDTVASTVTRTLGANLERLTLSGTAPINGTGNTLNNTLVGNSSANVLNGGTGIDTLIGGTGNDTYYVDNAADITTETSTVATEIDTVVSSVTRTLGANLEKLVLIGTAAINGTGNALNNTLVGNSCANVLRGEAGNDVLNGGAGADILIGGLGNDTYHVDNASDVTSETSTLATEIDTVVSSVSRTLGANLERLTLSGTAAINGTGNTLNNTLLGNSGANVLRGEAGNDVLNGGLGNDTLIGGAGIDTFAFDSVLNATTNRDWITDFSETDDTLRLDRTVFVKLTTLGALNAGLFCSSATGMAGDSNDYLLYNTSTGSLAYDVDGSGSGEAVQFATLTTKPSLTAADFVVVA